MHDNPFRDRRPVQTYLFGCLCGFLLWAAIVAVAIATANIAHGIDIYYVISL